VLRGRFTTGPETLALAYFPAARLPRRILAHHRIRIRDALARRRQAFVR
jgi:hypothetical protein